MRRPIDVNNATVARLHLVPQQLKLQYDSLCRLSPFSIRCPRQFRYGNEKMGVRNYKRFMNHPIEARRWLKIDVATPFRTGQCEELRRSYGLKFNLTLHKFIALS
jgi:hypothetical protein